MNRCYVCVQTCITTNTHTHSHTKYFIYLLRDTATATNKTPAQTRAIRSSRSWNFAEFSFNSAHITQRETDFGMAGNDRFTNQKTKLTDTSTASRLAEAWDGSGDVGKHSSTTCYGQWSLEARYGKLSSQRQHMERDADGFYDGSQASAHRSTMPDVTPREHGSIWVEVATVSTLMPLF